MAYKALRKMLVARTNGEHVTVQRGELIPADARLGRNIGLWIQRGWLTDEDGNERDRRHRGQMLAQPQTGLAPASARPEPPPPPPPVEQDSIYDMRKGDLIETAHDLGLDASGTKAELITRIEAAEAVEE